MKKSLVALAALAASSAFAQVTISGLFDAGYQTLDLKGNKVTNSAASNGSGTTAVVFGITEDLGGGLKFNGRWEIDPALTETTNKTAGTAATGTTSNVTGSYGNGSSFVGVSGGFGEIRFGTPNSQTLAANGDGNSGFATAIGSGYRVHSFDAVRFLNSLRYDSPVFGGFSFSYLVSAKNDKQSLGGTTGLLGNQNNITNGRDEVSELGLTYAQGPLTVRYADLTVKQWGKISNSTDNFTTAPTWQTVDGDKFRLKTLSAKYEFNAQLTAGAFFQTTNSDPLTTATSTTKVYDRNSQGISAAYAVTPTMKLMINVASVKTGADENVGTANKTTNITGLGADYALSKRTNLYFRSETNKDEAGARSITGYTAVGTNTKYSANAVGIRHTF